MKLCLSAFCFHFTLASLQAFSATEAEASAKGGIPAELVPLVNALKEAGYEVYMSKPPVNGAYGATNARQRKIWLAPISVEMGIARQVLIHEAVHAAQACPKGIYKPIGWEITLPKNVEATIKGILYRKYRRKDYAIEKEAFYMQNHPNAFTEITMALKDRCR